ncbi:Protein N-acetyltransferase, RimJ/RimL family [Chitinophaga jiangningensis]|uniref:Protein N-acetyltransferase, RimJ/RimL family n=2 Tax=Chitinophaga jiangningensis TaxID=1419482 RepID=A0A1M7AQ16_9BACT|nr:Protein N-acetyltransferase, RimJ/RimL family [Chitinophaga jiangningensis]
MPVYQETSHPFGTIELWPMDLQKDIPVIYKWVTQPYATYWGMTDKSLTAVALEYSNIFNSDHSMALMGKVGGITSFLCEVYDPAYDLIGSHYQVLKGDVGMHLLIGPAEKQIHGFTWAIFSAVMDFLFQNPAHQRVIVEPDTRNEKIHRLNRRAGFVYEKEVQLPHKTAALATCTREHYQLSKKKN